MFDSNNKKSVMMGIKQRMVVQGTFHNFRLNPQYSQKVKISNSLEYLINKS